MTTHNPLCCALLRLAIAAQLALLAGCLGTEPITLGKTEQGSGPRVVFDVYHLPFAEIPLPNDFATVYDASSPTRRRLNASIMAGTSDWERATRAELDKLSGWGTLAPITVSFSAPIDPEVIFERHYNDRFDYDNDAVLVLNVTPGSPGFCEAVPLDLGQGNHPQVLQNPTLFEGDPRSSLQTVPFEEVEEDVNGNGVLDPGEDTDMDGVLDHPNTRDGKVGSQLLEFYERETNTLIMKPVMPMREATTYAAVVTRRLTAPDGTPVRSPFDNINHASQTLSLEPLPECLERYHLATGDVAFTWSFTTQSISDDYKKVRDGLYGIGPLAQLATDFPAELANLRDVRDAKKGVTNTKIAPLDVFMPFIMQLFTLIGDSDKEMAMMRQALAPVDFIVAGDLVSPQLFPRDDATGKRLPPYKQVWDLDAPPRPETMPFWMFVPKQRKGPAPVALYIHGHGSCKYDAMSVAGVLASYGIATVGFEAPGHSCTPPEGSTPLLLALFKQHGLTGLGQVVMDGRALDWDGDGENESGADYWTSYLFHTRDMVRQTMVDVMQFVRLLRGFDGKRRWAFDPAQTGKPGLAGDFDGDGVVDVGGAAPLHVIGGSLGGINGAMAAGVEPALDTVVAIVPGGLLGEIGPRSTLGGVKVSMLIRALTPVVFARGDKLLLRTVVGQEEELVLPIQSLPELAPQDTAVLTNNKTGEYRCAAVQPDGNFAVAVSSDEGDPLQLRIYRGPAAPRPREGCEIPEADPYVKVETFGEDVDYGGKTFAKDSPLVAPSDGFGQRRGTPDLRRFLGLAQIAVEAADPMNWAPYWDGTRTMTYGTGETTRTRVIVAPSAGDPGVPVATGIALARAAGFIEYDKDDPRYGKPQNQVLIDTWAIEGINRTARYLNSEDKPVLMDVDHFAQVIPVDDGLDVPRLDPPLRLMRKKDGGYAGFMLPMFNPAGAHTFASPDPSRAFDIGLYLFNIIGRYMQSGGEEFSYDACQAKSTCPWPTVQIK